MSRSADLYVVALSTLLCFISFIFTTEVSANSNSASSSSSGGGGALWSSFPADSAAESDSRESGSSSDNNSGVDSSATHEETFSSAPTYTPADTETQNRDWHWSKTKRPKCIFRWLNLTSYNLTETVENPVDNSTYIGFDGTITLTPHEVQAFWFNFSWTSPENLTEISNWISSNWSNTQNEWPENVVNISVTPAWYTNTSGYDCITITETDTVSSTMQETRSSDPTASGQFSASRVESQTVSSSISPVNTTTATLVLTNFSISLSKRSKTHSVPITRTRSHDAPTPYPTPPPVAPGEACLPADPNSYEVPIFIYTSTQLQNPPQYWRDGIQGGAERRILRAFNNFTFEAPWIKDWHLKPILPEAETPPPFYTFKQIITDEDGRGSQNGFLSAIDYLEKQFFNFVDELKKEYNITTVNATEAPGYDASLEAYGAESTIGAGRLGGEYYNPYDTAFTFAPTLSPPGSGATAATGGTGGDSGGSGGSSASGSLAGNATDPPSTFQEPTYPTKMYRRNETSIEFILEQFPEAQPLRPEEKLTLKERIAAKSFAPIWGQLVFEPEEDEVIGLYFTPAYFAEGPCRPKEPQLVAKILLIADDKNVGVFATNIAARVITSIAIATSIFSASAAMDAQSLIATGFMNCARPNERLILRMYRLLSPFTLEESYEHFIYGNLLGLGCLLFLQLCVLFGLGKGKGIPWDRAQMFSLFPGAFFTGCCLAFPGFFIFAGKLVLLSPLEASVALGYCTFLWCALIPIAAVWTVREFVTAQFNTHKFHFDWARKRKGVQGSKLRVLLPYGKWFPVEIRRAYSGLFAEYRLPARWLPTYPLWGPTIICFIVSFRSETDEGCAAQYFTMMTFKFLLAAFAMVIRPYRSAPSNVLTALSQFCFGLTMMASGVEVYVHNADTRRFLLATIQLQLAIICVRLVWLFGLNAMEATFIGDRVAASQTEKLVSMRTIRQDEKRKAEKAEARIRENELLEKLMPQDGVEGRARPTVKDLRMEEAHPDPFASSDEEDLLSQNLGSEMQILSPPQLASPSPDPSLGLAAIHIPPALVPRDNSSMNPTGGGNGGSSASPQPLLSQSGLMSPRGVGGGDNNSIIGSPQGSFAVPPSSLRRSFASSKGLNTSMDGSKVSSGQLALKNFSFRSTGLSLHEEIGRLRRERMHRGLEEDIGNDTDDDDFYDDDEEDEEEEEEDDFGNPVVRNGNSAGKVQGPASPKAK